MSFMEVAHHSSRGEIWVQFEEKEEEHTFIVELPRTKQDV